MKRIFCTFVMMCPGAIWAQDFHPVDAKPGLYETTSTMEMSGMTMPTMPQLTPDQMSKLPPAARAQMEAVMKNGLGAPRTTVSKSCVTREMLNKPLYGNGDKACTTKLVSSSSSSQKIHVECTRGNTSTKGDLTLDRVDSEHLKGNMLMTTVGDSTAAAGQNVNIKITFNEKWLAADCGDVKPTGGN